MESDVTESGHLVDSDNEPSPPSPTPLSDVGTEQPTQLDLATQARLEALLEAAGIVSSTQEARRALADPEILRRLTTSVSSALDEAAATLSRIRAENDTRPASTRSSLAEACANGDYAAVSRFLNDRKGLQDLTQEESESLLSLACSAGYFELAQVLVSMRTAKEGEGAMKHDATPLMEAASGGYVDIVRLLNSHGAEVNAQTEAGNTALTYAACGGYEDVIQFLLDAGATIEEQNESGHTALMEAASAGHIGVAKLLLSRGASINTHSNEFKESALTLAAYKGHADMVHFLLENGANMDHKTDEMHNALMEACMDGHVEVARVLLDHGAVVDMPTDSFESPLTLAACGGHIELAALLITRGANLEEVNDEGYTPLMEAAREGNDVVQLLVENGANVNAITEETQETALTLACCGGLLEVSRYLLEHGSDIELGASTPLMEAAQEGHADLVKFLIEKGASVDATTSTSDTALTFACANGHTDVAEILLEAGAELEHKSEGGRTPLMKAARAGHLTTVDFLVSKGASVNMKTTNNDHTVLSLASAGGHLPIVMLLLQQGADPAHILKDSSTMLIETSKGGHVHVAALLLEQGYPDSRVLPPAAKGTDVKELPGNSGGSVKGKHKKKQKSLPSSQPDSKVKIPKVTGLADSSLPGRQKLSHNRPQLESTIRNKAIRGAAVLPDLSSIEAASFAPLHTLPTPESIFSLTQLSDDQPQIPAVSSCSDRPSAFTGSTALVPSTHPLVVWHPKPVPPLPLKPEASCPTSLPFTSQLSREALLPTPSVCATKHATLVTESLPVPSSSESDSPPEVITYVTERSSPEGSPSHNEMPAHVDLSPKNSLQSGSTPVKPFTFTLTPPITPPATPPLIIEKLDLLAESLLQSSATTDSLTTALLKDPVVVQNLIKEHPGLRELFQASQAIGSSSSMPCNVSPTDGSSVKMDEGIGIDSAKEMGEHLYPATIRELIEAGEIRPEILHVAPPPSPSVAMAHILYDPEDEHLVPTPYDHVPSRILDEEGVVCDQLINSPMMNLVPHVPAIDIDMQTESNHDTALTLAAAGGHDELVELLLEKGADLEHRDKKGCSPLILSATAGHSSTSEILLQHCADMEAQSDRTKDTALSLACSGGRQEVIEILLSHGANFEHRNMSDYTPLSLAASGGYVGIIKTLLQHGAEINSRTGSKLGISPLMLAAMNGHTAAVKLLLDMGSDINAQIETNRNTALTLACFQGRHEVVSLLVERKANVEHRAKTGLTPLMEAASGGYVEVGKVLLERGADVNALPVPSSKDTALTIAADKGHAKFVELLLEYGAQVDVHNKKGASPLWLACNGGHWEVVQHLINAGADPDAEDNRRVSCLVAAFRRGHVKVVKYLVKKVTQFPNDTDGARFISAISDKELLKRCKQSMEIIVTAKDRQAAEANKHATILLQELDQERTREENRKAAAARKRTKRRRQKQRKKEEKEERDRLRMQPRTAPDGSESESDKQPSQNSGMSDTADVEVALPKVSSPSKSTATIQINLQESPPQGSNSVSPQTSPELESEPEPLAKRISVTDGMERDIAARISEDRAPTLKSVPTTGNNQKGGRVASQQKSGLRGGKSRSPPSTDPTSSQSQQQVAPTQSPRRSGKRSEEGWKEVVRKIKRISVPGPIVSRVMGRSGSNIVAIRQASGAHVDVERGRAGQDRMVTIRGNTDAIRIASNILTALMKEPDHDVNELLPGKHNQVGSRRGSGTSVVRGIVRMQQPQHQQLQQALGLMKWKSQTAVKASQAVHPQSTKQPVSSQPAVFIPQPQNMSLSSKPSTQPLLSQPSTSQPPSKPQLSGVRRQLFSTAAAQKPSQTRAFSLTTPTTSFTTKDILQQKVNRSASVPAPSVIPSNLTVSSLFSQVAQSRSPSVWSTAGTQKAQPKTVQEDSQPSCTIEGLTGTSMTTTATVSPQAVSTITPPLSHFEPLITQTASATSSKAPSPAPSPNAVSPCSTSPGAIGQRETRMIAPIGKERTQETNQEKLKSLSPAGGDKQEERQTPAPIGTGRNQQQQSQSQKQAKQSEDGGSIKPIGTERAHRRTGNVPTAVVNPGFPSSREQPSLPPQLVPGMWGYPGIRPDISTANWIIQPPPVTLSAGHPHLSQHGGPSYGNSTRSRSLESLASLLDRLSLSKHLNLFQRNEIDLDALMLMSEKDYAEIGLPKGPRIKLLNATGRLDETSPDQYSSQTPVGVVPYTDGTVQQQGPYPTSGVPSTIAVAASRAWASVPPVQNTALIGEASVMMDNGRLGKLSKEQQVSGDGTRQVGWKNWNQSS